MPTRCQHNSLITRHVADEAVSEVKRQAVSELQKAVAAAEQKANELIQKEREKMQRAIEQARREATEETMSLINSQEDTSEVSFTMGIGKTLIINNTHNKLYPAASRAF